MEARICNVCGEEKPLSEEFYSQSIFIRKDGSQVISFRKKCLVCHNKWQKENYHNRKLPKINDGHSKCNHCDQVYLDSEFKTAFMCIICFKNKKSECDKQYRKTHKEEKSSKDKEYRKTHKYKISDRARENRRKKAKLTYKHRMANDPVFVEKKRIKSRENAAKNKSKRNKQRQKRRKIDLNYRLRCIVSKSIWGVLKLNGGSKNGESILKYLPYTIDQLKEHLESKFESWMDWKNQGAYRVDQWDDNDPLTWKWQIDHKYPQSKLPYSSMNDENFQKAWALDNLQPLSAKENLSKRDK